MKGRVLVAPSLLGCDHGRLADEARRLEDAGADMLHLDVMDGVFVPVLTAGPDVAAAVSRVVDIPVDAHLMVQRPENLLEAFAEAGCAFITVHVEVASHLTRLLQRIRDAGCSAGVAVNPATSVDFLRWTAPSVDLLLLMTVDPGYGGQEHMERVHHKIPLAREILDASGGGDTLIAVDGGVSGANAGRLARMGADVLVSGSWVTGSTDPAEAIRRLR